MGRTTPLDPLRRLFRYRRLPLLVGLVAVALTLPSLGNGLLPDDMIHRALLLDEQRLEPQHGVNLTELPWFADPAEKTLVDKVNGLFVFVEPEITEPLMDTGLVPWWTYEGLRVSFFRPVAALTHIFDYALWPHSFVMMHLHSILWYGLAVVLAAIFFRRVTGSVWAAGLAALIFAVDETHVTPATWIANRNALIALCFGLAALILHDRWRRDGRKIGAVIAPLLLALSVFSAEAGVAVGAFLVAYALFLEGGKLRGRLASLAPYVAVGIAWHVVYKALGHGASGSGMYIDPACEPGRFAWAFAERGPVLLAGQWGYADPRNYNLLSEGATHSAWLAAVALLLFIAAVLLPLLLRNRGARFFGVGMVLALVPICGMSLTSGRHLLFVGLGATGLMALFIAGLLDRSGWLPRLKAWRLTAWVLCLALVAIHLCAAPVRLAVKSRNPFAGKADQSVYLQADGQDLIIVNSPNPGQFFQLFILRHFNGLPLPPHSRILAPGYHDVELTRIDERTVEVRPEHGYLVPPGKYPVAGKFHAVYLFQHLDLAFRSYEHRMSVDDRVELDGWNELDGMTVTVTELTPDGRPAAARMRFYFQLKNFTYRWLYWDWQAGKYAVFTLPAIGEKVRVPGLSRDQ